ncbi:MAG TPA: type II secretion system F family protein [Verrucomicrobiae bacterium]|jgi:type IV pilus assembly protein PilC|nr:type II secretion system F family protein [Verrucomicrobiae bacterium]
MPVFEYEVADRAGALSRGRAQAENAGDLILRFREQGRLVVAIRPAAGDGEVLVGAAAPALTESIRQTLLRLSSGVGLGTLVLFTGQLAAMLGGGLHLVRILTSLAGETTNQKFRKVLMSVRDAVTGGTSFADALGQFPFVFDKLYVSVVRAGELSGSLPGVLDTLTVYLEKTANLRRKVRGAIAYPSVILFVSLSVVFIMIVKIVPIFENVYARANATLPAPTRTLIWVSGLVRYYTMTVILLVLLAAAGVYVALQTSQGRRLFDRIKLGFPLFGQLIRKAIMARVCRTLAVLLNSGIPLIEAMETVSRVAGNRVIEHALTDATRRMRDGGTIAATLRETGQFPVMIIQLVATGEESGTLPTMLGRAAVYYEQQVDNSVATLSTLIEPVMIVIMGAIAGAVIFALYLPIFTLGQAIRGGVR